MAEVQTVVGTVSAESLGCTLMHEHIAFHGYEREFELKPYDWDEIVPAASEELAGAVAEGVRTLVEATPIGNGRSPRGLAGIAGRTGLNIVAATGFWCDPPLERLAGTEDVEALADLMVREITQGMDGTGIRAGVIKVATSEVITPAEERVLRAAARACRATGAAIITHTQRGAMALAQVDLFEREGVDLSRVVIGHIGGTLDLELHLALAKRGVYLGYDRTGQGHEQDDAAVAEVFAAMVKRGFQRQLLVSQDTSVFLYGVRRPPLPPHLGGHSLHERPAYTHVLHGFAPQVRALGVREEDLHAIFVQNPARLLPLAKVS